MLFSFFLFFAAKIVLLFHKINIWCRAKVMINNDSQTVSVFCIDFDLESKKS